MSRERAITLCGICDAEILGAGTVCHQCQRSFETGPGDADETIPLDLGKYDFRMFPWEQIAIPPRLISVNPVWLFLALGMVVLVLLLALLRTPLPSCWELSS